MSAEPMSSADAGQRCGCLRCLRLREERIHGLPAELTRMVLCATCGCKRCPHATDHRQACTNSNEAGQLGSVFGVPPADLPAVPPIEPPLLERSLERAVAASLPAHCSRPPVPFEELKQRLDYVRAGHQGHLGFEALVQLDYVRSVLSGNAASPPLMPPVDLVLHCPACGLQHIDKANSSEVRSEAKDRGLEPGTPEWASFIKAHEWTNPPHRSHLCAGCGHIWRPSDVTTNGVVAVSSAGEHDSPLVHPPRR